ncbi:MULTISPECIES: hypothetical protein [Aerococcus]|nr:hypothetical protein [Aerococcus urinae]MDL5184537.1 hypothetical protein [Aerococcus mictus]MDK6290880.1 hypothetical protein [Aerococcus urinae]MDK6374751.1 hypothetical protein [Aerococcus urinae]MDK6420224.1 hypothetical protein [Aerococcus urinae]MDK8074626.1 hypothetical protein [Aerococcus urinae]
MAEIIFDKSRKNLKRVYERIKKGTMSKVVSPEVLFLAMGGYNRTFELLLAMGLNKDDIAIFSNLNLSRNFIEETDGKQVLLVKKINYLTTVRKGESTSWKTLDLNVADEFEEEMMIYANATRSVGSGRYKTDWLKPSVVVLDDPSLNLQYEGHRFRFHTNLGFVQVKNRNVDPYVLLDEIKDVEPAKRMMFAMYQKQAISEEQILDALSRLMSKVWRREGDSWYVKPTEFKEIVGSNELANILKETQELGITQFKSNKRYRQENARWIVIPDEAFEFKGFDYKDEEQLFQEELEVEKEQEQAFAEQQEEQLNKILFKEFTLNLKTGYIGKQMARSENETLQSFISTTDDIENEVQGIELLSQANTEEEYKDIKKHNLCYFLDGVFKDDERNDSNYVGGKRLISIDIDDGDYTRESIEDRLQSLDLFGLVYPTPKYYFNGEKRWRIILMADKDMTKKEYKHTVKGVADMLSLEFDPASAKISQLMGYPLAEKDISTVVGTLVNVDQFQPDEDDSEQHANVVRFKDSNKSLLDFDHAQARLLKEVLTNGVPEGRRNETYYQVIKYLRDTQANPEYELWFKEALDLEALVKDQMRADGLDDREIALICREEN